MKKYKYLVLIFAYSAIITTSNAHNIKIFAAKKGNDICGYIYSPGGIRIKNSALSIYKNNEFITEIKTDDKGEFIYKNITTAIYKFTYNNDGHLAEYTVNKPAIKHSHQHHQEGDNQIFEIKEQLNRIENQMRIRDIIGAIGYIIGIAGLISFIKKRNLKC